MFFLSKIPTIQHTIYICWSKKAKTKSWTPSA